jgi:hypothetical protein
MGAASPGILKERRASAGGKPEAKQRPIRSGEIRWDPALNILNMFECLQILLWDRWRPSEERYSHGTADMRLLNRWISKSCNLPRFRCLRFFQVSCSSAVHDVPCSSFHYFSFKHIKSVWNRCAWICPKSIQKLPTILDHSDRCSMMFHCMTSVWLAWVSEDGERPAGLWCFGSIQDPARWWLCGREGVGTWWSRSHVLGEEDTWTKPGTVIHFGDCDIYVYIILYNYNYIYDCHEAPACLAREKWSYTGRCLSKESWRR